MNKNLLFIFFIFLNLNIYGKDNKCTKCFKSCINTVNYENLSAEEMNKLLKEGKLSIVKDKYNILNDSNLNILKYSTFTRDGSYYTDQYLTYILNCKCCEECQKKECINSK